VIFFRNSAILSLSGLRSDGLIERPDGLSLKSSAFERKFGVYLNYWISSGGVAESSGRIAETSQTVSISENRLLVEY
jgi:hypothetical protein